MTFQGTVPVRKALQLSLNVPAVALLDRVGASRLSRGCAGRRQSGAAEGRGAGPCDGPRRRRRHAAGSDAALFGLARLGTPCRCARSMCEGRARAARLMDPVAAWQVGNVLIGTPPPENAAGTTASPSRPAPQLRLSRRLVGRLRRPRTIGVWVGRPDGAPVPGLVGRTAAAPILFDAFARTGKLPAALPKPPKGALVASNAKAAAAAAAVPPVGRTGPDRQRAGAAHPVSAERLADRRATGANFRDAGQGRRRRAADDHAGERVSVGEIDGRRQRLVDPPGPGFARLTVIDATGAADTVVIRIQ
jgi:penicillin-binding protein 1C